MSTFERGPTTMSDAALESLLRDFFHDEMPADLRDPPGRTASRTIQAELLRRQPGIGREGLIAVAASLLMAAAAVWSTTENPNTMPPAVVTTGPDTQERTEHTPKIADGSTKSRGLANVDASSSSPPWASVTVTEQDQPVERFTYETQTGPVEQQTTLHWTNLSVYDPESGDHLEIRLPEIMIEIIPIDDESEKD